MANQMEEKKFLLKRELSGMAALALEEAIDLSSQELIGLGLTAVEGNQEQVTHAWSFVCRPRVSQLLGSRNLM